MNLEDFTDNQLQAELFRRREVERAKELAERNRRNLLVHEHIDTLLLFVQHKNSKCDDEHISHGKLCSRCELLECKMYNLPLSEDHTIEISVYRDVL
jgi:hypothetical protein